MAVFWQTMMKHGRHLDALVFPELEGLLVVAVESLQRRLQAGGKLERVEFFAFAAPFLGHVFADVLPEVAEHGHLVRRGCSPPPGRAAA